MSPFHSRSQVLIVEDDSDLREALSQILEDEGYGVSSAEHGRAALEWLREGSRPCLILLDLTMPVMNGWQFRAEQKQDPMLASIPVVVISAGANLAEQIVPLEIEHYIRKPIQLGQLLATVQRYCHEPDARPDA
ncbi:MAG TPA: response regulator [Thermoanaerobaculia bacterium]|jgi:CheY-like chemotaxis protein